MTGLAKAEPVGLTGLEGALKPLLILMMPLRPLLLSGPKSDPDLIRERGEKAKQLAASDPRRFSARGLYLRQINLRQALKPLLVYSAIPYVEVDIRGSQWLFDQLAEPQQVFARAEANHAYIRLKLTSASDPTCVRLHAARNQWHAQFPVRPDACLGLEFTDTLASDLEISVNTERLEHRELEWVLKQRASGETLLKLPFWEHQIPGQPFDPFARYSIAHEGSPFALMIHTLVVEPPQAPDGKPFVIPEGPKILGWPGQRAVRIAAVLEPATMDLNAWQSPKWEQAYADARGTNQPVLLGGHVLMPEAQVLRPFHSAWSLTALHGPLLLRVDWTIDRSIRVHGYNVLNDEQWLAELLPGSAGDFEGECKAIGELVAKPAVKNKRGSYEHPLHYFLRSVYPTETGWQIRGEAMFPKPGAAPGSSARAQCPFKVTVDWPPKD